MFMMIDNDHRSMNIVEPREGPDLRARWDTGPGLLGISAHIEAPPSVLRVIKF